MGTGTRGLLAHACRSAAASVLLISASAVAPVIAADSAYTPTMKDWMSIQEAMHNYHEGLDRRDNKIMAKAFTENGTLGLVDDRGIQMSNVIGRDKIAAGGLMSGRSPPDAAGGPPAPGDAGDMGEMWHFTGDDHYVFESPTRATHYGYWLEVRPGQDRKSIIGIPGHYEDVLVKQKNGEWLFKERKIIVGKK